MTTKELSIYLNNEDAAEEYLRNIKILQSFEICPKCKSTHFGRIRRSKYKCYECGYEWNIRKDSFLQGKHISLSDFIGCLKFFADGVNATQAAKELQLNPKLLRQLFNDFRTLFLNAIKVRKDKLSLHINEANGKIRLSVLTKTEVTKDAVLTIIRTKDSNGAYSYKINYKNFSTKNLLQEINKIDKLDHFYRYCQERILNFRGRNIESLIEVVQELVYRYNNHDQDLFEILIKRISEF
jgi:transposase